MKRMLVSGFAQPSELMGLRFKFLTLWGCSAQVNVARRRCPLGRDRFSIVCLTCIRSGGGQCPVDP